MSVAEKRGANHWDNLRSCAKHCGQFEAKQSNESYCWPNDTFRHFSQNGLSKCWPASQPGHSHINACNLYHYIMRNVLVVGKGIAKRERERESGDQTVLFNLWRFVNILRRSFNGSYFNSTFIAPECGCCCCRLSPLIPTFSTAQTQIHIRLFVPKNQDENLQQQ